MKKSLSVLFAAATLAAACAGSAWADPANGGVIVLATPTSGLVMTGAVSSSFTADGAFDDMFMLITPPPDATDVSFSFTAGAGITFTDFTIDYFGGGGDPIAFTGTVTSTGINIDIPGGLISGVYQVDVKGSALTGSSYTGTVSATTEGALPVPEPSSYLLLGAGLGVVGWMQRRRAPRRA